MAQRLMEDVPRAAAKEIHLTVMTAVIWKRIKSRNESSRRSSWDMTALIVHKKGKLQRRSGGSLGSPNKRLPKSLFTGWTTGKLQLRDRARNIPLENNLEQNSNGDVDTKNVQNIKQSCSHCLISNFDPSSDLTLHCDPSYTGCSIMSIVL